MVLNGKGDKRRPFDRKLWSEGYDTAFSRQLAAMKQIKRDSVKKPVLVKDPRRD